MLNSRLYALLVNALDMSALKQTTLSNNIANVNTPGYKKYEVNFQEVLKEILESPHELSRTTAKHLKSEMIGSKGTAEKIARVTNTALRNDGNNVDIDLELAELAENNLYFNSLTELLSSQLALLRAAITEGRG